MDKITEEVLNVLAERFGTTAGRLWETMVSYYIFWAYLEFGLCFLFLSVFGFLAWGFSKKISLMEFKKDKAGEDWSRADGDNLIGWMVGKRVCIVIGVIGTIIMFVYGLLYLFNAEYCALRDILGRLS